MIGEIRLAWWREALQALDVGIVPAQPLLQLVAAELLPHRVSGTVLARFEDRWLGMIGTSEVSATHVDGGADLFGLSAQVLGGDISIGRMLGRAWVLGDAAGVAKVPAPLRPLLGLVRLAQRDAAWARRGAETEARGSLGRQFLLLKAIALGR